MMIYCTMILMSYLCILLLQVRPSHAYVPRQYQGSSSYPSPAFTVPGCKASSILSMSSRLIEIPLLDFLPSDNDDEDDTTKMKKKEEILVQPLPSVHLQQQPPELASIHVYGMKLIVPLHQQIINHAWDITTMNAAATTKSINTDYNTKYDSDTDDMMPTTRFVPYNDPTKIPLVGVVAYKSPSRNLKERSKHPAIGAIGCAVEVLYNAAVMNNDEYKQNLNSDEVSDKKTSKKKKPISYNTPSTSKTVLCRGLFRFIVRGIKQSIPYTVALVEELRDGKDIEDITSSNVNEAYTNMTTPELMQCTLQSMQFVIDQMMENAIRSSNQPLTLLEESILQDTDMINQQQQVMNNIRETAQEYTNIWTIFCSSLIDMTPEERYYSVPIMAAEICHFPNIVRRSMLITTNPIERLRIACEAATVIVTAMSSSTPSTIQNTVVSSSIEGTVGGDGRMIITSQNLNVGSPTLPSWSKKIKKGTILEYYWNEEYGWCRGQVIEDPLRIVPDEIVLTMHFPDDDSTHRLPFSADEKVRWRPPSSSSSSSKQ